MKQKGFEKVVSSLFKAHVYLSKKSHYEIKLYTTAKIFFWSSLYGYEIIELN